ncbi:hypothetical protein Daus18300_002391 [Diaporthe australafricana]|uniref:Uncharacterized protein n=1 Tax=Diaporthe australafricana TaxID=127596 RepID=A0ABR3XPF6_9PEZI
MVAPRRADGHLGLSFGQAPGIFPPLAHLPTMLIEHWFRYVCPMWSAFDSDINFNRQLARSTWTVSGAVFYAMQAMSAACLVDSMPALIGTLPTLRTQATTAIKQIIADQGSISLAPKITADLVFAVFALGTSSSWGSPAPMELPWLQVARKLLPAWEVGRSQRDGALRAYFCQALTYWEMLLTISGLGSMPDKITMRQQRHQNRLRQALFLPDGPSDVAVEGPIMFDPRHNVLGTRPNSRCGVSNEVIDTFGQILALCRSARRQQQAQRNHDLTMVGTTIALCDIAVAHELQRELLALDFGTLVSIEEAQGFHVQTQDDKTPIFHLVLTAEAYRQAGLLQLHLTFVDLPKMPFNGHYDIDPNESLFKSKAVGCVVDEPSRDEFLHALSLHLLATLDRIPVESGSSSMHSVLYLSAAAGLKFDTSSGPQDGAQTTSASAADSLFEQSATNDPFGLSMDLGSFDDILLPQTHPDCIFDYPAESASTDPHPSWTIARARQFVLTRLSGLQQSVPQRARDGTLQLVNALWVEYDAALPGCPSVHWLDLVATGARTVLW